jgi:hypothetical protein
VWHAVIAVGSRHSLAAASRGYVSCGLDLTYLGEVCRPAAGAFGWVDESMETVRLGFYRGCRLGFGRRHGVEE